MIDSQLTPHDTDMAMQLLDGSTDGLLLVDGDGRIVLVNGSATTMFGYDDAPDGEGLVGRLVDDLVPDEQRVRHVAHRDAYAGNAERRPMGTDLRLFAQHRTGQMFPAEISLSPVMVNGSEHVVATVRDVTEREESRAKLLLHEERERIAHDLHDLVIQRLFAAGMSLQSVTNLIGSPVARDRVLAVTDELDNTIRAIRSAIFSIGTDTDTQDLASRLRSLVTERSRHLGFTPDLVITGSVDDLPDAVGDQLVATLTEAVTNVANHADATDATIRVARADGIISLLVRDNGRGIAKTPGPLGGLSNLMWRATELGGSCSVSPVEPSGTELVWQVPV